MENQKQTTSKRKLPERSSLKKHKFMNDLISEMPDEVLSLILSHLSLREVVKTSVLSKRWRSVWTLVPILDLDVVNIISRYDRNNHKFINQNQDNFIGWVNQVLEHRQFKEIKSFRLRCFLCSDRSSDIDRWLQVAINKALENLEIDFSQSSINTLCPFRALSTHEDSWYRIPNELFDGRLLLPLKHLSLAHLILSQDVIGSILTNCPNLQRVSILACVCPSHLELASQRGILPLKHFSIISCNVKEVAVYDAVGLLSYELIDLPYLSVTLHNTAHPISICYSGLRWRCHRSADYLDELMADSTIVETLVLSPPLLKAPSQVYNKLLDLTLDLSFYYVYSALDVVSLWLTASPYLKKLQIALPMAMRKHSETNWTHLVLLEQHKHLKEIVVYKFNGKQRSERELIKYIFNVAIGLETMKIYRNFRLYLGSGQWMEQPRCIEHTRKP